MWQHRNMTEMPDDKAVWQKRERSCQLSFVCSVDLSSWTFAETLSLSTADKLSVVKRAAGANLCSFLSGNCSMLSSYNSGKYKSCTSEKGLNFNLPVIPSWQREAERQIENLIKSCSPAAYFSRLECILSASLFKHDRSNEPISHEIDFWDK